MRGSCERCGHVGTLLAAVPEPPPVGSNVGDLMAVAAHRAGAAGDSVAGIRPLAIPAETWRAFADRYACPECRGTARWARGDLALICEPAEDEWAQAHGTMVVVLSWVDAETVEVCPAYRPHEVAGHYRHDELEAR